jgi:hypothetical protein
MNLNLSSGDIIGATLLIAFGMLHLLSPNTIRKTIIYLYKDGPFIRSERQLEVRQNYIFALGVVWIFTGILAMLL